MDSFLFLLLKFLFDLNRSYSVIASYPTVDGEKLKTCMHANMHVFAIVSVFPLGMVTVKTWLYKTIVQKLSLKNYHQSETIVVLQLRVKTIVLKHHHGIFFDVHRTPIPPIFNFTYFNPFKINILMQQFTSICHCDFQLINKSLILYKVFIWPLIVIKCNV